MSSSSPSRTDCLAETVAGRPLKVAVLHEWLVVRGGAELVLEEILMLFPNADVFTLVRDISDEAFPALKGRKITTSFIQKLPFGRTKYRAYLALMPLAIEQFDVSGYDLVVSSSYAVTKGILTGPDQLHISYVHSPIRYAWDLYHSYLKDAKLTTGFRGLVARLVLHYIRIWDSRTATGVDHYIANSKYISRRIRKVYGRCAEVIYPPVPMGPNKIAERSENYYFTTARMVPYKKIPLIVEAFSQMPHKKLIVAGDGPDMKRARRLAGQNIEFVGFVPKDQLYTYMQKAKAFVYAAEEDFGIVLLEAQSFGTPVIAYGKGGALETVVDGRTGVLFRDQTVADIQDAVDRFERAGVTHSPKMIGLHARRFGAEEFRTRFSAFVREKLEVHLSELGPGTP